MAAGDFLRNSRPILSCPGSAAPIGRPHYELVLARPGRLPFICPKGPAQAGSRVFQFRLAPRTHTLDANLNSTDSPIAAISYAFQPARGHKPNVMIVIVKVKPSKRLQRDWYRGLRALFQRHHQVSSVRPLL